MLWRCFVDIAALVEIAGIAGADVLDAVGVFFIGMSFLEIAGTDVILVILVALADIAVGVSVLVWINGTSGAVVVETFGIASLAVAHIAGYYDVVVHQSILVTFS
ncbi:hypothetical protein Bpfe_030590 [Biomphalaria pfeifferi]|uniref:Uncharacterized protein n=1 Tax=Biomphalaria pfeifferi TaxID=112525 RepID=A0AAD8APA7_BIOPF|nr:hypothetical protein Bpfe_030590 [Biomphalaria pfeifferi]